MTAPLRPFELDITAGAPPREAPSAENGDLLRTVVENAPLIVWSVDRDGRFTLSVGKGLEPLGLEFGEVVGQSAFDVYRDVPQVLNHLRRALSGQEFRETVQIGEFFFDSWCSPRIGPHGEITGVIGVATDVTACKQAEHALQRLNAELEERVRQRTEELTRANQILEQQDRERRRAYDELEASRAKWQSLVENAPDFILTVTRDGRIEFVNYTDPTRTIDDVLGSSIYEYLPEPFHEGVRRLLSDVFTSGQPGSQEVEVRRADGSTFWLDCRVGPIRQNGHVTAATVIARDITRQREAEEEVKRKQEQLAHVSRLSTVGEMIAALAHELNQPLAAISYYASGGIIRLQSGNADLSELSRALEDIASQAHRASEVTRRLRGFLQHCEMHCTLLDLEATVKDALQLAAPEIRRQGVRIHTRFAEDLPQVCSDNIHIVQVLINLVLNALDAMRDVPPAERNVWVTTKRVSEREVQFSIRDRGQGLPTELGECIFEPFVTTKPQGLGMGLSISRSIVTAFGGRIWAEPNDGPGATFYVTFPVQPREGAA